MSIQDMTLSAFGLNMIQKLEGCKLTVYLDSKGVPTIGVGHRMLPTDYRPGLTWTHEEAMAQLAEDLRTTIGRIKALVKVPLSQYQFDALVSFVFNIGQSAFAVSTMLTLINSGEYMSASEQFLKWTKLPELKRRREQERAVFFYGTV